MSDENDAKVLNDVQDRFEVNITGLPEEIDISSYSKCSSDCSTSVAGASLAVIVVVPLRCMGLVVDQLKYSAPSMLVVK